MLCASEGNLKVEYDAWNKPISMARGGTFASFSYGSENARYAQQSSCKTVRYIDKLYERINLSTHQNILVSNFDLK